MFERNRRGHHPSLRGLHRASVCQSWLSPPPTCSSVFNIRDHLPDLRNKLQPALDSLHKFRLCKGVRLVRFDKFAKMTGDFRNIGHALRCQLGARVPNRIERCYVAASDRKSSIWVRERGATMHKGVSSFVAGVQWKESKFVQVLFAELCLYSACGRTHR